MAARNPRYSLSLDRSDFEDAERLVKALLLTSGKKGAFNTLTQVTENYEHLAPVDREYIESWDYEQDGDLHGLCCWSNSDPHEFAIWISPQINPMSDLYRVSVLHELVHGYLNHASHDAKFRDVLGRALFHYCDIVSPLRSPGFEVAALNYRYTRRKKNEDDESFFHRLILDKEATQERAEKEFIAVQEMYERIA